MKLNATLLLPRSTCSLQTATIPQWVDEWLQGGLLASAGSWQNIMCILPASKKLAPSQRFRVWASTSLSQPGALRHLHM
eukprot:12881283-Prorocentrum_lima.AAC.1